MHLLPLTEGTAGPPQVGDFSLDKNTFTFDSGSNDGNTISVFADVFDDNLVEGTESFTVSVSITDPGTGIMPTLDPAIETQRPSTLLITMVGNHVCISTVMRMCGWWL